jgi:hypothetical protein
MALILSAASGNFNAGATWVGGVVPTTGDEARASTGHTITITANASCTEISNAGTGIYVLNSGVTLTANVTPKGGGGIHLLVFSAASPAVAYIVGNVIGSGVANSTYGINSTGTGTLNITGNVTGGNSTSSGAVNNASTGTITITGSVTGGQVSGNSFGAQNAIGTLNITGNVTGGVATNNFGVNNTSTGQVTIIGNVTGTALAGVNNASSGTLTITGDCTASLSANAVNSTSATPRVSGSFNSASNGRLAVNASAIILLTTPTAARTRYALNGTGTFVDMFTADNTGLGPATNDVRSGVTYSGMTGSLAVPLPSQVAVGVATDDTVGTAALTADNLRAALGLGSANLDSQLAVLSNLDTTVSSRLAPNGTLATVTTLTNAPASVTPSDIWSHATRTLTSASGPTAVEIRQEIDANSTKLDAAISSRMAASESTKIDAVKAKTDNLPASPAATGDIPSANITAIKAKTDALNTERLANVATTNIVGTLLAQSQS